MNVLVDGRVWAEGAEASEAAVVCREVAAAEMARGRTVVAVMLDGIEADALQQERLVNGEDLGAGTIEFRTAPTTLLATATLDELARNVAPLREALEATSRWLAEGERRRALEAFRPSLELWMTFCETAQRVCLLMQIDVRAPLGKTSVAAAHERIAGALSAVEECIERQDWTQLAEVVSQRLLPSVDEWESIVKALSGRLPPAGEVRETE